MSSPFLAEIRMFGFNFAPVGWALCDGQLLPISQNTALFSCIGTFYGGNGTSNFALPNFQNCSPMGSGQGPGLTDRTVGEMGGEQTVTLLIGEIPAHSHSPAIGTGNLQASPSGNVFGSQRGMNQYAPPDTHDVQMNATVIHTAGGSQPHNNMPPYLTVNFCIALQGIFPSRN
jgi:microcystin-dependent protein